MFKIIGDGAFAKALSRVISDKSGVISDSDYTWVIPCVPSYALPEIQLDSGKKILFVSKGIVRVNHESQLVSEWARKNQYTFAYLAGPHLASELQAGLPSMSTIATTDRSVYDEISKYFLNPIYSQQVDLICLAGVVKNIIAYASGLFAAANWGENVRACLITASLKELFNVANHLGIQADAGQTTQPGILADLILTGTSTNSRNFKAGFNKIKGTTSGELTESHHSAAALIARIGASDKWPIISLVSKAIDSDSINSATLSACWDDLAKNYLNN
jgi:glycerol-3-phosphate dehydrogenase